MSQLRFPMKLVVRRTGLSPHVLRVWERRYGAVRPERTESNRRHYSQAELDRLILLAQLTHAGHGIGEIATLPTPELEALAEQREGSAPTPEADPLEEAWRCVRELDPEGLHAVLEQASVSLGIPPLNREVMVPLIERIGSAWETGELSIAEEHAASAVIKELLLTTSRPFSRSTAAPNLVVATPTGQLHELGAALVSSIARSRGWQVTYLGPSLPASEIARAALAQRSRAVALSIVYPGDDPSLPGELARLRRSLPGGVALLVGGRSPCHYAATLDKVGATRVGDLESFADELQALREAGPVEAPAPPPAASASPPAPSRSPR